MYIGIVRLPTNAKFESCYACAILIEKALILSKTYIYILCEDFYPASIVSQFGIDCQSVYASSCIYILLQCIKYFDPNICQPKFIRQDHSSSDNNETTYFNKIEIITKAYKVM